jgi:hypothetical protein
VKKLFALVFVLVVAAGAFAQGKGVDQSEERVRDEGSGREPANNGSKTDTGTGRGIRFGKEKSAPVPLIPNPYRFTSRRDDVIKAVVSTMRDHKMVLDEAASRPVDGIIISQPYTFSKGAVISQAELNHYADAPTMQTRGWTRGRYTLIVEIQAIDAVTTNVSVNAKVEGRTDGASGAEWTTLRSSGVAEQEFLNTVIESITGAPAPGHQPSAAP